MLFNLKRYKDNPQILCRTSDEDFDPHALSDKIVGFFMPVYKCKDLMIKAIKSLVLSMPENYPFGLIVVDGGSGDQTIQWCRENGITCVGQHTPGWRWKTNGLCFETPNACIETLLGPFDNDRKEYEQGHKYSHICWLHSDMTFPENGWMQKLVEIYDADPEIGILGPCTDQYKGMPQEFKEGNVAPFIISTEIMAEHHAKHGWFYPPEMYFCVGYCDWAMHQRFMELGYKSLIYRDIFVNHPMMGTREIIYRTDRPERDKAWRHNEKYYKEKYNTNNDPWNSQKL
jgi:glycosyltransferase involved in cell wall biosynthesis